jgi:hypothetical protein
VVADGAPTGSNPRGDMSISDATIGISVSIAATIYVVYASKNPCKGYDILSINFAKYDANQSGSIVAEIMNEANFVTDTKTTIGAVACKTEAPTHMSKLRRMMSPWIIKSLHLHILKTSMIPYLFQKVMFWKIVAFSLALFQML